MQKLTSIRQGKGFAFFALACALSFPAYPQVKHRPAHKKSTHDAGYDAAVASAVAQMRDLDAEAHPLDSAAQQRAVAAQATADRAQIGSDKITCRNKDALALRMRNASLQEQNYLMSLCGRR